jgi:hypothetical protein
MLWEVQKMMFSNFHNLLNEPKFYLLNTYILKHSLLTYYNYDDFGFVQFFIYSFYVPWQ